MPARCGTGLLRARTDAAARRNLSCLPPRVCSKALQTSTLAFAATDSGARPTLRGEPRFWRISAALFIGGAATFALLYCVQPMMPAFAMSFALSPADASLTLSAATGVLAVSMFDAGTLSNEA